MEPRQALDPQQFARVWGRVTEAGGDSRLQVIPFARKQESLGKGSVCHNRFLRQRVREELTDWRTCTWLASFGPGWQTMRSVAGDELCQAKRLSTASFLITGEQYFPRQQCQALRSPSWQEGMRTMFLRAKEAAELYRREADQTRDDSLRELFQSLSQEESLHALHIRRALERWG